MMIETLKQHKKIGIDIDHTLISHSINKRKLQLFILENHKNIDFYLITFRTRDWFLNAESDILKDFPEYHSNLFQGLYGVPVALEDARQEYYNGNKSSLDIMGKMLEYHEWKGKKCRELGCTILVDDMENKVLLGCYKYNIEYIHPDTL